MFRWIVVTFVVGLWVLGASGCLTSRSSLTGGGKSSELEPSTGFACVETEGFTGPVHEQYRGKVVFSNAKIPRAPADDSKFKNRFSLEGPLYMRVFLEDSLYNLMVAKGLRFRGDTSQSGAADAGYISFEVEVNGAIQEDWVGINFFVPGEQHLREFTVFGIDDDSEINLLGNAETEPARNFAAFVTPLLQPGENTIRIHVTGQAPAYQLDRSTAHFDEVIASGEFRIRASRRELISYTQEHGPRLATSTHPENAELVKKFKEAINREWPNEVFLGASTLSPIWSVEVHPYTGDPISRSVDAEVVLRKGDETTCRHCELTFFQALDPAMDDTGVPMRIQTGVCYAFPCSNAALHER